MLKNTTLSLIIFLVISLNISISQTYQRQLFYDGNNRSYVLHIPSNYNGTVSVPLLFNFHGGAGFANQFMTQTSDMRSIADTAGFILVYPQALEDPNDGNSTNWLHKSPTNVDDIYFIQAIIDTLNSEYQIDNNRIYASGHSLGGEFTYELACRLNTKIAAVAAVARTMGDAQLNFCTPVHPTGILTILGTADQISLYGGVIFGGVTYYVSADNMHAYWSNYNNTDISPVTVAIPDINTSDGSTVERRTWANGDNCVSVEELKVNGGGHDWPGSFGNMDINANNEIWNFVSQYNMNGLISCSTNSISETQESMQIKAYPNPVINNQLKIELNNYNLLEIRSIDGRLVWTNSSLNASDSYAINTSNWNGGMYLIYQNKQQVKKLLVVNN